MQLQKPVLVQEQRQKLSPQMIQSIRLMALPLPELKDEIQQEIEANPALEVLEDRSTVSLESFPEERESDSDAARVYENASDPGYGRGRDPNDDSKRMFLEGAISRAETLQEHLLWQLRLQPVPEKVRAAAENLIQNLDSDGFHKEDPRLVCRDTPEDAFKSALSLVRGFEPVGVCASDYRESLIVQAELCPEAPPRTVEVLRDHIELLEKGKHEDIRKRLKLSEADLSSILAFIKTLNPFPGRQYSSSEPQYVIPDIQVKLKDGEFVIVLNDEEIPVLGINPFFDRLSEEKHDRTTDVFVKENIRRAKWFIQSIHQRNKTLLKATRAIVEFQRSFFTKGPKHLAPLTLRDIAGEVGVHETTISRLANRKYVQTDWGIFELKYFFTNSISGAGSSGSRFSKEGVKQVIKEIIENEARALSDRDIADQLARKGINLARRTVAKYRLELNMDSSFGRRHE
ncbi:MAG TPA: RNA polymerase factor sigma-54 [Spirochaetia bacterium]|nr:RNA polymerase factor sigma-54 [Spirochaetales bacterium]HRY80638.1 RNA polymerase factor sigma-54 [Spirochaetia bacterium]HRZ89888.1 RNA polymerase factor sigma-54 [Spirochaetia bacterium]